MEESQKTRLSSEQQPSKQEYSFEFSPLRPDEQVKLNELRKRLLSGPELTDAERTEYQSLSGKEETGKIPEKLTPAEEEEFTRLSREQTLGENWSPEKAERIRNLYARKIKATNSFHKK